MNSSFQTSGSRYGKSLFQGLTMMEILVSILILAILARGIFPYFKNLLEQNRVRAAAQAIYSDIYLAQSYAKQNNVGAYLKTVISGNNWCYGIASIGIGCNCTASAGPSNCNLGVNSSANYPGTTLSNTFANGTIFFSGSRAVGPGAASIGLTCGNYSLGFTFTRNTMPFICTPSGRYMVAGYPIC